MANLKPLMSLLLLFFAVLLRPTSAVVGTSPNATDYIRTSCATTLYPDVCYNSLSGYSNAVQRDPTRLARVAINVSLKRARQVAAYVSNLSRAADYGGDHRAAAALHDCFSNFGDAVEEIQGSLKQMKQLVAAGSESFRFQMSNVQTWMSAALTDEETCTDGFEDIPDGPKKAGVCQRAAEAKKYVSNALALVNVCAQKVTP